MISKPFIANVYGAHGSQVVIDLQGEINGFAEREMMEAYQKACNANPTLVVLNFTKVTYINSTGIALIVSLLTQANKAQQRLAACGLSEHYSQIFHITRLDEFIQVFPDEASALAFVA